MTARRWGEGSVAKIDKHEPRSRWRVHYRVGTTRYSGGTYATEREAKATLAAIRTDVDRGVWADPAAPAAPIEPPTAPTFAAALDAYIEYRVRLGKLRPQTADDYRGVAARWLGCGDTPEGIGAKPLDEITPSDCDRIVADSIDRGHLPGTTKNIVRVLNSVLRFSVRKRQWIDRNPAEGLEVSEAHVNADDEDGDAAADEHMTCITADQAMALAASFDHAEYGTLVRLTVFGAGLRAGEVEGLKVRDFDSTARTITVARRVRKGVVDRPKSRASRRTNDLPAWLADEMTEFCLGRNSEEPMFRTPGGAPFRMDNFRYKVFSPAKARVACRSR